MPVTNLYDGSFARRDISCQGRMPFTDRSIFLSVTYSVRRQRDYYSASLLGNFILSFLMLISTSSSNPMREFFEN